MALTILCRQGDAHGMCGINARSGVGNFAASRIVQRMSFQASL